MISSVFCPNEQNNDEHNNDEPVLQSTNLDNLLIDPTFSNFILEEQKDEGQQNEDTISESFKHDTTTTPQHSIIEEQPFKYSIKSTSKKRYTHPEQYEAQLNWKSPNEPRYPIMRNNYINNNPNLKLYQHDKRILNILRKNRRSIYIPKNDPSNIQNMFDNIM